MTRRQRLLAGVLILALLPGCIAFGPTSSLDMPSATRDQLRHDLPALVLAASLLVLGAACTLLGVFYWSALGLELLSFGSFSFFYGVRLLAWTPAGHLLVDLSPVAWSYLDAVISYFIPVPVLFFIEPFLGKARIARWAWRVQLAYALVATAVDIVLREPFAAIGPYRVLVMAWFGIALYLLFRRSAHVTRQLKIIRAGLLVFVVLAAHATLSSIVPVPGSRSAEPAGLLVFFLCIGYVVVDRFFASRKELVIIGQELETARRIQSSVLPEKLPSAEKLDFAVRYLPVSAVAGDFYDYLEEDRGLSVLVADVSGHGVPAALIASMVKVAYSAQAGRIEHPSAVLSEVNRILCGKIRGQFVTGGCLFFDAAGRRVLYASAGHPPLIVIRGSGDVVEVKLDSILMGFFADVAYRETDIALQEGDKVVLYTDGLVEAMNQRGEFFGVERFHAFLRTHGSDGADALASRIIDHVAAWSGRPFDDDVTLLVVGCV
jgi:sigma-B regulation protein RsbU (phosphoserine phosphatase)